MGIDKLDKKILLLLSQDPEMPQTKISESLKISQPAVNIRLHKLQEKGILTHLIGVNIKKAEIFLARVDISTDNTDQILSFLNTCPIYLNSFLTSGKYNLTIFFIGENIRSLISCVNNHLRQNSVMKNFVRDIEFSLVVNPVQDFVVPIKPILDKKKSSPCGTECSSCSHYIDRCLGCPATINYKGVIL